MSDPDRRRIRALQLWIGTSFVSNVGSWMQATAIPWILLTRPGSSGVLDAGFAIAAQYVPQTVVPYVAARIADRYGRQLVLIISQVLMAGLGIGLFVFLRVHSPTPMLLAALFVFGCAQAASAPVRQAMIADLSDGHKVMKSVAWASLAFNGARLIGPSLFAVMLTVANPEWAVLVNAGTFGLVAVVTHLLRNTAQQDRLKRQADTAPTDTLRTLWRNKLISSTVLVCLAMSIFGLNFSLLMPALLRAEFNTRATTWATFSAVYGAGAIVGALVLTRVREPRRRVLVGAVVAVSVMTIAVGTVPTLLVLDGVTFVLGLASQAFLTTANATIQMAAPKQARARVMALQSIALTGAVPVGSLTVAGLITMVGPSAAAVVCGCSCLLFCGAITAVLRRAPREELRPCPPQLGQATCRQAFPRPPARSTQVSATRNAKVEPGTAPGTTDHGPRPPEPG